MTDDVRAWYDDRFPALQHRDEGDPRAHIFEREQDRARWVEEGVDREAATVDQMIASGSRHGIRTIHVHMPGDHYRKGEAHPSSTYASVMNKVEREIPDRGVNIRRRYGQEMPPETINHLSGELDEAESIERLSLRTVEIRWPKRGPGALVAPSVKVWKTTGGYAVQSGLSHKVHGASRGTLIETIHEALEHKIEKRPPQPKSRQFG